MIDPARLAKIRELEKAATKGPWYLMHYPTGPGVRAHGRGGRSIVKPTTDQKRPCDLPDRTFIADSRTAVPELLEEIDRLRAENERLTADKATLYKSLARYLGDA